MSEIMTPETDPDPTTRIRERAYALWQNDGCPEGQADRHWRLARDEQEAADRLIDVEEEDSFPASDPPSRGVVVGVR